MTMLARFGKVALPLLAAALLGGGGALTLIDCGAGASADCKACPADASVDSASPGSVVCNGHSELCTRTYDRVAFAGTHNAYSTIAQHFEAPDQSFTMSRQLNDGIRVLHLEIWPYAGDAYLCHSLCEIGRTALVDGLSEISAYVSTHPNEVVTLLMESSGVTADAVAEAVQKSGLSLALYTPVPGAAWPTLGQMIAQRQHVVAFLADLTRTGGRTYPWLIDRFSATWETPWNNQVPTDFGRCNADRGASGKGLYVVDTYLEDEIIPTAAHAALVNDDPFLISRLRECRTKTGFLPNFAMVNFYEVGNVLLDVDVLNGFAPPPAGLTPFPPQSWGASNNNDSGATDAEVEAGPTDTNDGGPAGSDGSTGDGGQGGGDD